MCNDNYASHEKNCCMESPLRKMRLKRGLTTQQLADLAGTSQGQIVKLEKGLRKLTKEWAERLAPHLGCSPATLLFPETSIPGAPVLGTVQAGVWREASEDPLHLEGWDDPLAGGYERIPCPPDRRYPHAPVFALRVEGDSMDRVFPPGSYALCVRLADAGLGVHDIAPGSIVVCQRRRHDIYEATLKRLRRSGDDIVLEPDSPNPRHKPILLRPPRHAQETETTITALVVGKYERL